jgi:hypothetical protein
MQIKDLEPCTYWKNEVNSHELLAVGWLGNECPRATHKASKAFVKKLEKLINNRFEYVLYMGSHFCELCKESKRYQEQGQIFIPCKYGKVFAAPTMIVHYIKAHGYVPPKSFIDAVMETETIGGDKYESLISERALSLASWMRSYKRHGIQFKNGKPPKTVTKTMKPVVQSPAKLAEVQIDDMMRSVVHDHQAYDAFMFLTDSGAFSKDQQIALMKVLHIFSGNASYSRPVPSDLPVKNRPFDEADQMLKEASAKVGTKYDPKRGYVVKPRAKEADVKKVDFKPKEIKTQRAPKEVVGGGEFLRGKDATELRQRLTEQMRLNNYLDDVKKLGKPDAPKGT